MALVGYDGLILFTDEGPMLSIKQLVEVFMIMCTSGDQF